MAWKFTAIKFYGLLLSNKTHSNGFIVKFKLLMLSFILSTSHFKQCRQCWVNTLLHDNVLESWKLNKMYRVGPKPLDLSSFNSCSFVFHTLLYLFCILVKINSVIVKDKVFNSSKSHFKQCRYYWVTSLLKSIDRWLVGQKAFHSFI